MKKDKTEIVNNIQELTNLDLRTELLFDALLDSKVDDQSIVIKPRGLFYRKYSRDKMSVSMDAVNTDIVNIDVSRDGFYDILPESFVHNYRNRGVKDDAIQEFKIRKKEEKEARNFFSPLENELFRFRHIVENYESDFFAKIDNSSIIDIIKLILVVDNDIPDKLIVKMFFSLLKLNENAVQTIENIVATLENILEEKVSFRIGNIELENTHDELYGKQELVLGINTTLQSNQKIFLKKYNFTIGPLKDSNNLQKYFNNGSMDKFVNAFFNLFLPFHIQFTVNVILDKKEEQFVMEDSMYKSRLGISTVL
jgi:hypothetical protein